MKDLKGMKYLLVFQDVVIGEINHGILFKKLYLFCIIYFPLPSFCCFLWFLRSSQVTIDNMREGGVTDDRNYRLMVSPSYYSVIGFRLGSLVLGSWWRPWVFGSLLGFPLCQTKLYFFLIFFGRFSAIPNETTFFSNSLYDNAIKDNSRSSSPEVFCGKGDLKLY